MTQNNKINNDDVIPRKSFKDLIKMSWIFNLLHLISSWISNKLVHGFFGNFFTRYQFYNDKLQNSYFVKRFLGKLLVTSSVIKKFRRSLARRFENSLLIDMVQNLTKSVLRCSLKVYGVFILSFGIYTIAAALIYSLLTEDQVNYNNIIFGAFASIVSLPLFASRKSFLSGLSSSRIMSVILIKGIGIPQESFDDGGVVTGKSNVAFVLGLLLGVLTVKVSPILCLVLILAPAAILLFLYMPEFALISMVFLSNFLVIMPNPSITLAGLVVITTLSYVLKLIRGKRMMSLELFDWIVIAFMGIFGLGGVVSFGGTGSIKTVSIYLCFMLIYFLCANLLRTKQWLLRCVFAVLLSATLVSLLGLYQNFAGLAQTTWIDTAMFEEIEGRVVSTFENPNVLGQFLILILPFAFAMLLSSHNFKAGKKYLLVVGLMFACLIYTWSRGAWIGLLLGMLIFFLIYSKNTWSVLSLGVFAVPFLPFVLPDSIVSRIMSIGNTSDTSTSYRVYIWKGAVRMVEDFFFTGIGVGESAFRTVYPLYTFSGIESAPHSHNLFLQIQIELGIVGLLVFLLLVVVFVQMCFTHIKKATSLESKLMVAAGLCSILGALLQGMTDYIWYNYRVFFVFWMVIGLTVAYIRHGRREQTLALSYRNDISSATAEIELIN